MVQSYVSRFSTYSHRFRNRFHYKLEKIACLSSLPSLSGVDRQILSSLNQTGIGITSLDSLGIPHSDRLLATASRAINCLPPPLPPDPTNNWHIGNYASLFSSTEIASEYTAIYLWGMEKRLLNLITHYIRQPIAYLSVNLRRDLANGQQLGSRVWHRDREDYRMLKVIIYLNDTDAEGGAFEYLPKALTPRVAPVLNGQGTLSDEDMAQLIPRSAWQPCPGLAGTVIFVDTALLWHHGKVPQRDRYSVFFTYTSRRPLWIDLYRANFKSERAEQLLAPLSPRQQRYVLWGQPFVHGQQH